MRPAILELLADRVESAVANLDPGSVMARLHPALLEALDAAYECGRAEGSNALERWRAAQAAEGAPPKSP